MVQAPRPVDEVLAELAAAGFVVIESNAETLTLERTNSRLSAILGVVVGGFAGGVNPSPRRERLYVRVHEGLAVTRLAPPGAVES